MSTKFVFFTNSFHLLVFLNIFLKTGETVQLIPALNDEEEAQMKRMVLRINSLAEHALKKNVRLMVDAEQTYFQPAISRMVVEMMRQFNRDKTVIMNTYQCYLKVSLLKDVFKILN